MSNLKLILKKGLEVTSEKEMEDGEKGTGTIEELISKAFTTRNLLHFKHWNTQSYSKHEALGSLYDDIIEQLDKIVEVYQGKFGLLSNLSVPAASVPEDILAYIKAEVDWVCKNKCSISQDNGAIKNLLDELEGMYLKTIYKLENLH